jgi:uncharacterized protein (TIGR03382 family)
VVRLAQTAYDGHVAVRTAIRLAWVPIAVACILAPRAALAIVAESRVIYLNHAGATLEPGTNDSRVDTSTLVDAPVTIAGWQPDAQTWQDTYDCVRGLYAAFDVKVVDYDPMDVPHMEAVFGGGPAALNLLPSTLGISPFAADCGVIENSMVFVFTDVLPADPHSACYVAAQEIAHSYGLDHEMLASDPMSYSYMQYSGDRLFQDKAVACGEYAERPCGVTGTACRPDQNSFALLTERLGKNPHPDDPNNPYNSELRGGCTTTGRDAAPPSILLVLAALVVARRRRRR